MLILDPSNLFYKADHKQLKSPGAATDPVEISCVQTFPFGGSALKVKYVVCASVCLFAYEVNPKPTLRSVVVYAYSHGAMQRSPFQKEWQKSHDHSSCVREE